MKEHSMLSTTKAAHRDGADALRGAQSFPTLP